MTGCYRYDPRTALFPGFAGVGLTLALSTLAFLQTGERQIAMAALAALAFVGLLGIAPLVADRRVQLSVSAEGLTYRPFSPQPIPWDDITAVAVVRTTHRLGRLLSLLWKETLVRESINFDVLDANRFARGLPLYRLGARLRNSGSVPSYPVETTFLQDADMATLTREIRRYWKGSIETLVTGAPE